MPTAGRLEIAHPCHVAGIDNRIKLSETSRATLRELRMEGERLKAAFTALSLNADFPVGRSQIEVGRHALPVWINCVELAIHVAGEKPARARLIKHGHDARCGAAKIRDSRELHELHRDGAIRRDG